MISTGVNPNSLVLILVLVDVGLGLEETKSIIRSPRTS